MSTLDAQTRNRLKETLATCPAPWAVCGIADCAVSAKLDGIPGLIDWLLHGQVSRHFLSSPPAPGGCALFPGDPQLGRPSFLLFQLHPKASASSLLEQMRKLAIHEVALAETTFPEDFLHKLKQNLGNGGIRWQSLEPTR